MYSTVQANIGGNAVRRTLSGCLKYFCIAVLRSGEITTPCLTTRLVMTVVGFVWLFRQPESKRRLGNLLPTRFNFGFQVA
ncbi:MAG: hypothetical protein J6W29_04245 [Neisseriaceae bacterium]|nr:hypothetical protein [Neisseriaceae bacterium]